MALNNTYSRVIISGHRDIKKLIEQYNGSESANDSSGLSEKNMDQAIQHPNAEYLQACLQTLATITRGLSTLTMSLENVDQYFTLLAALLPRLRIQQEESFGELSEELSRVIVDLEAKRKDLFQLYGHLQQGHDLLTDEMTDLNTLATLDRGSWLALREEHETTILEAMQAQALELNQEEIDLFKSDIGWHDLVALVTSKKVLLPSNLDLKKPSIKAYFRLKTYLVMTISMQRRGLNPTLEEIVAL